MNNLPRLTLSNDAPIGMGTVTTIDGHPVHGLTDIELRVGTTDVTRVTLSMLVGAIEVDTLSGVRWKVVLLDGADEPTADGDTVLDALRALVTTIESGLTTSNGGV